MKKNINGFTLIELIAVIAIIALLALIAIPLTTKYLQRGKDKYYNSLKDELVLVAKNYYSDNPKELPRGQLNNEGNPVYYKALSIVELKEKNLLTNEIVDDKGNSCDESYIETINTNGNYTYNVCLICNGVIYSNQPCDGERPLSEDNVNPNVILTAEIKGMHVTINADITDNVGVVGYTITNSSDVPSVWTEIASTKKTEPSFDKKDGEWYIHAKDNTNNTFYKKITIGFSSWSDYSTTMCDTSDSDLCKTINLYRTRTSTAIGGRWTAGYVPTNSYGYYNDGNSQPYCTGWSSGTTTVSSTCQTTSAPACSSSGISYVSSCTEKYQVYCGMLYETGEECMAECSTPCYAAIDTNWTCPDDEPDWIESGLCNKPIRNVTSLVSCPTNYEKYGTGTSTYCMAFSKVTKTRKYYASTYKYYKYNSNWSAYTTTACVEDGCGGTNGNCCDVSVTGYSTRTYTYKIE